MLGAGQATLAPLLLRFGLATWGADHYLSVDGQRCAQHFQGTSVLPDVLHFGTVGALSEDSTTASLAPYVDGATYLLPLLAISRRAEGDGSMEGPVQFIEAAFVCSGGGHPVFFAVDLAILTTEVLEESGSPTWPATDFSF